MGFNRELYIKLEALIVDFANREKVSLQTINEAIEFAAIIKACVLASASVRAAHRAGFLQTEAEQGEAWESAFHARIAPAVAFYVESPQRFEALIERAAEGATVFVAPPVSPDGKTN